MLRADHGPGALSDRPAQSQTGHYFSRAMRKRIGFALPCNRHRRVASRCQAVPASFAAITLPPQAVAGSIVILENLFVQPGERTVEHAADADQSGGRAIGRSGRAQCDSGRVIGLRSAA